MSELGIDRLSVDERLDLLHEIWESITLDSDRIHLTEAQRVELERRLAEHDAQPEDVVSWEDVKAEALDRFRQQ